MPILSKECKLTSGARVYAGHGVFLQRGTARRLRLMVLQRARAVHIAQLRDWVAESHFDGTEFVGVGPSGGPVALAEALD